MPVFNFSSKRTYNENKFSAQEIFKTDRMKVIFGYFEPQQFIPVHAPSSDIMINIKKGTGIIQEGEKTHNIEPGDIIVVEAETKRGIRANKNKRLETLIVVAPPPTDKEHKPVKKGIKQNKFRPKK